MPQITWQLFKSLPIPENPRYRVGDYVTRDNLIVSYVNISSVTPEDSGLYTCLAANDVQSIEHSSRINIYGSPSIRQMPNVTRVAGMIMTITCPVGGWPIDAVLWEKGIHTHIHLLQFKPSQA
jgi:hypothetical protein